MLITGMLPATATSSSGAVCTLYTASVLTASGGTSTAIFLSAVPAASSVIAGLSYRQGQISPQTLLLGSVTATLVVKIANGTGINSLIYTAQNTSSGNATATFTSAVFFNGGLSIYTVSGLASTTATATGTSTANPLLTTISTVSAGGFALGIAGSVATSSITWSGITQDFLVRGIQGASTTSISGASLHFNNLTTSLVVTATFGISTTPAMAVASFR